MRAKLKYINCPVSPDEYRRLVTMAKEMGLTQAALVHVTMRKALREAWEVFESSRKHLTASEKKEGYQGRARNPQLMEAFKIELDNQLPVKVKTLTELLNNPARKPFRVRDIEGTFRATSALSEVHYPRTAWEYWDGAKWEQLHDINIAWTITVNVKKGEAFYLGDEPWIKFSLIV